MDLDKSFIEKILTGKINLQESKYTEHEKDLSILIECKIIIERISNNDFTITFGTKQDEVFKKEKIILDKNGVLTLNGFARTITIVN